MEQARTSFGERISDAFMPKQVKKLLYTEIVSLGESNADINGWSFMHMLSGVIIALFGFKALPAFVIHTLWELFQATVGDNKWDYETLVDVPMDTLFFMIGWWIGTKFYKI